MKFLKKFVPNKIVSKDKFLFFILISIIYLICYSYHESWRDEFLHFILVRDFKPSFILNDALIFEGSPPLFYLILKFLIYIFSIKYAIFIYSFSLFLIIIILLINKIKSNFLILIIIFSNPFFYTYGFFARPYILYILFILAYFISSNIKIKYLILMLFSLTGVHGLIFTISIIFSEFKLYFRNLQLQRYFIYNFFLFISSLVCLFYIFPRPDRIWNSINLSNIYIYVNTFFGKRSSPYLILSFFIFFIYIKFYNKFDSNRKSLIFFSILSFFLITIFNSITEHVQERHFLLSFIYLYPTVIFFENEIIEFFKKRKFLYFCILFLPGHVFYDIYRDVKYLYSDSSSVRTLIFNKFRNSEIAVYPDYCVQTLASELNNKVYQLKSGKYSNYILLKGDSFKNLQIKDSVNFGNILINKIPKSCNLLILTGSMEDLRFYKKILKSMIIIYETKLPTLSNENYLVYKIN